MSDFAGRAVFISYASQDAEAARRMCEALREVGVEVWFDRNELRGGDSWDAKIRRQIAECTLFVPVISATTQARREAYFRLEWKLADERTHLMAEGTPFLLPVVIDATSERGALVPKSFLTVQWTRLPAGDLPAEFQERVRKLLAGDLPEESRGARPLAVGGGTVRSATERRDRRLPALTGVASLIVVIAAITWFVSRRPFNAGTESRPTGREASAAQSMAPAKSIAVLPFENLSPDPENEFFADGMHDEVISGLSKVRDLTVIARASVVAYRKPETRNLRQIAAELNVAHVLLGRVFRAGNQVKVSVELINPHTNQVLWSNPYTEELTHAFSLQAKLASAITGALKATLSLEEKSLLERRPTQNPVAYELYLRARAQEEGLTMRSSLQHFERVAAAYQRVVEEDPSFAFAYAQLTLTHARIYWFGYLDPTPQRRKMAEAAMHAAVRIAPEAPETYYARGAFDYFCDNDWTRALTNYRRAEIALPNDAALQGILGYAHRRLGNWPEAVRHLERAVALGPRNLFDGAELANFLIYLRRFESARQAASRLADSFPNDNYVQEVLARSVFAVDGDRAAFLKALAAVPPGGRDPTGLAADYSRALLAHDFPAAEKALADTRLTHITDAGGILGEPVALHRALVASLLGKEEDARRFAEEARTAFDQQTWAPRQSAYLKLGLARAKAYAGHREEALREAQAAVTLALKLDAYGGTLALAEAGRMYAWLGYRTEALAALRALMAGICRTSPNEIRLDPLWLRLKDDPDFEAILRSAKAF